MSKYIVLEPIEIKYEEFSCLYVKDFPGCPPGFMVVWDTEFSCHDCGEHIYEIVNRQIPHECRRIDAEGKDRPVLDEKGEKTYYNEDAYIIICPRCMTYRPDDERIGEFDHKEMIVELYDQRRSPEPGMLRYNRWRPEIVAPPDAPRPRLVPIDPAALAELEYYRQDRKAHALSKMRQEAIKAAKRPSHKDRPHRSRKRAGYNPTFGSDYTYGSNK